MVFALCCSTFWLTRCASIRASFPLVSAHVAWLDIVCIDQINTTDGPRVSLANDWLDIVCLDRCFDFFAYAAALFLDCVAGRRLIRGRARERCRRRLSALLLTIGRVSIKSESAAVSHIDTDGFGKGRDKAGMQYKHKACFKGLRRDRVVGDRDSIISLADNVSLLAPSRLRPSYLIVVLHSAGACTSTYTNQFHLCLNQLLQKGFYFSVARPMMFR